MNKEPIGLYIFRFVLGLGLFGFMCMLYWSSTLIETRMESINAEFAELKNVIYAMREETGKLRSDVDKGMSETQKTLKYIGQHCTFSATKAAELPQSFQDVEDETPKESAQNYPNMLQDDPFYEVTLPKLLGKDFRPKGIQRMASVGKPDNLHPFTNWSQASAWQNQCSISISKSLFGKYETMSPDMAVRMEERVNPKNGQPEFWIFLRDDVFWEPLKREWFPSSVRLADHFLKKHQVTAEDFKFYFDAMKNPYVSEQGAVALRTYYDGLDDVEVVDKLTLVVRWQTKEIKDADGKAVPRVKYAAKLLTGGLRPLASFVYKYFADGSKIIADDASPNAYRTNSVWAQNFAVHWAKNIIVSCGPWTFNGMNDRQINFVRARDYYDPYAALTQGIDYELKDSLDTIWQTFKNNQLDSYSLQSDKLIEFNNFMKSDVYQQQAAKGDSIHRLDYVARSYAYIGWNEARPLFTSAKVRRALTMAIDRRRIIDVNLNGLGIEITGTFFRFSPNYDPSITPWPYNPRQARRLLEEEGWYDSDGDGVIDKVINGKRTSFRFFLTYYVKSTIGKPICEYIATALKEVGIDCQLNGADIADLSAVFDDKSFDAVYLSWVLGTPPDDPRQLWHSSGALQKGSSNAIGFSNREIDQIIDQLDYEYDPKRRMELYHQFHAIIHQEQPYTFLYTPKVALLYRNYLQNVFIPADRQDLVPGADVAQPDPGIFWLKSINGV